MSKPPSQRMIGWFEGFEPTFDAPHHVDDSLENEEDTKMTLFPTAKDRWRAWVELSKNEPWHEMSVENSSRCKSESLLSLQEIEARAPVR